MATAGHISVELWEQLASQLGQDYRLRPYKSVGDMLNAVEQGQADVAIGAISVTADRERRLDFTQPMFRAGLGIATRTSPSGWMATLRSLFSWKFLSAVLALGLVLLLVGFVVWLLERRRNPEQFGGSVRQGIGSGFWWSAVTMTTVGYGDKAPVTAAGRTIGLVWMFASIITISGFTAAIASSVTVNQLQTRVSGVADLPRVKVGTVQSTSAAQWLDGQGIRFQPYPNIEQAMRAVALGEVDAVVYDAPVMRYMLRQRHDNNVLVLPQLAREESYAIAVANGSRLREPLDQALLSILASDDWRALVNRYQGAQ
ncbi:extracellular solute-binding protein family 3 [Alcanivorax hongdengensis A-11-3]|uniref:Extracellular solute-binding protein family 3 n=1 Tax=Alcanivorax hongdengensis A-11-3 TaxID=1177179 RepID=L0WBN9_9GAMM|nr:transporter substrate-binding domain-containing protein [Alcanivorax hongdengensis]EKF74389.1 extracellular solute-binding protein family 3 [Alcanivorax hongdengensis A-11-3]